MHRYLALGDSYTIGEGVADGDRWPAQLVRVLRSRGVDIATPEYVARSGWTTDELEQGIVDRQPQGPFALVTLLIGVNNQYRGREVSEYAIQLRGLLQRAAFAAGGTATAVLVVSLPDWGVTPFAAGRDARRIGAEIDAYNTAGEDEARAAGAGWVSVTDLSRAWPGDVVEDGLHPNAAAYARWAERLAGAAAAILRHR